MAQFKVQTPDGSVMTVDAPEGATEQQAIEFAASMYKPKTKLSDQIPDAPASRQPQAEKPTSLSEKIQGIGEAGLSMASGIPATLAGNIAGAYQGITGGKYGTQQGVKEAESTAADVAQGLTYTPKSEYGREVLGKVGEAVQQSGIAGIPASEGLTMGATAAPALAKTGQIAGQVGKVAGKGIEGVSEVAGKAVRAVAPEIAPETLALAKKAQDYGIPLRPDMLSNNKIVKMIGEALEKVPLSGAKTEERQIAFNKALIRSIGGDETATKLTPGVFNKAITKSGQKIGDISAKYDIPLDKQLDDALKNHVENVSKFETEDVAKTVNNYVTELRSKAIDGKIPGEAYRKLNSKIGKQISHTSNGDLKHALAELQDDMHSVLERTVSGTDRAALFEARKRYANAKTLVPVVAKSVEGDISPSGLLGRVTSDMSGKERMAKGRSGDLGELAKVGQRFLKEPQSSGTAERSAAYGMLGGAAVTNLPTTAGVYTLANLYNRIGSAATRGIVKANTLRQMEKD